MNFMNFSTHFEVLIILRAKKTGQLPGHVVKYLSEGNETAYSSVSFLATRCDTVKMKYSRASACTISSRKNLKVVKLLFRETWKKEDKKISRAREKNCYVLPEETFSGLPPLIV